MQPSRYEVMIRATIAANRIRMGAWYLESEHEDVARARLRFRDVVAEHQDPRLMVVLLESRYDENEGVFVDRILDSRAEGPVPAVRGSAALPDAARRPLRQAFGRAPAKVLPLRRRTDRPAAPRRRSAMPWVAAAAVATVVVVLVVRGF
jgi:hypothetical protein